MRRHAPLRQLITFNSSICSNNNNTPRPVQNMQCSGISGTYGCHARHRELHTMIPCVLGAPSFSLCCSVHILLTTHGGVHNITMAHTAKHMPLAEVHSLFLFLCSSSFVYPACAVWCDHRAHSVLPLRSVLLLSSPPVYFCGQPRMVLSFGAPPPVSWLTQLSISNSVRQGASTRAGDTFCHWLTEQ